MDKIRFIPDVAPQKVVGLLSETIDWGQKFCGVDEYRAETGSTGAGVKVAILDTGIDASHPNLQANVKGAVDFTGDSRPLHGHGTHVAGIVGAAATGVGVIGVAPSCELYSVRVLDSDGLCPGDYSWITQGVEWCIENRMDVINLSLGAPQPPPDALHAAILKAVNSGIIMVSASGNEKAKEINFPARYEEVISVAAFDKDGKVADFSNIGQGLDVIAPGVDIYSTWPGGSYARESGTSMASPFVAGLIALMIAYHRNGKDHDTPLTNWRDAIAHLESFEKPGPVVTKDGDPIGVGLLDFHKVVAQSLASSCEEDARLGGIPGWRINLFKRLNRILRKVVL